MNAMDFPDFYREVRQDPAIRKQIEAVRGEDGLVDLLVRLGKQRGHAFSSDEVAASVGRGTELSDSELENVAGGTIFRVNVDTDEAVVVKPPQTCTYKLATNTGSCTV